MKKQQITFKCDEEIPEPIVQKIRELLVGAGARSDIDIDYVK